MRISIPNDWDNVNWRCVEIQWPDSDQWRQILLGFLTQVTRGRFWNENTGSIIAAQQIGLAIFGRNFPWHDCCDCGDNDGDIVSGCGGSVEIVESEDDMPAITWLEKDSNGDLYMYFGPCCRIKVEDLSQAGFGDDPFEGDDQAVYSACGKADALVDALWAVLDAGWDAQSDPPWSWVGDVEAATPGYNLSDTAIWSLVQQSIDLDNDYSKADVLTTERHAELTFLASTLFTDDPGGITQGQYDQWRGLASVVFEGEQRQWALTGMEALGAGNSSAIAALGATNTNAVCDEPAGPPLAPRIFFTGEHTEGTSQGGVLEDYHVDYGGKRAFFQIAYSAGGSGKNLQNVLAYLAGGANGDWIKVRIYDAPTFNATPANAAAFATEPPWTERVNLTIEGGNPAVEQSPGSDYVEWTSTQGETSNPNAVKLVAAYRWPDPSAVDVRHSFYVEIVEINGESLGALGP